MAALASAFGFLRLAFPYPLMPFLKFDLAEIPDTISFILLGPSGGLTTALTHWFVLNMKSSSVPVVGPLMKLLAISSMMLGLYIGAKLSGSGNRVRLLLNLILWGMVSRVMIMGFATFVLYYALMPDTYIPFAQKVLNSVGLHVSGVLDVALAKTLLTAVFNVLHVPLSVIPGMAAADAALRHPKIRMYVRWLRLRD